MTNMTWLYYAKVFFITYGGQQQPKVDLFSLQLCLVIYPSCLSLSLEVSQSVQHSHQGRSAVVWQNHLSALESVVSTKMLYFNGLSKIQSMAINQLLSSWV